MSDGFIYLGFVGLVLALMGLAATWVRLDDHERRISRLEAKAHPGIAHNTAVAVTEALTDSLLKVVEDQQVLSARVENALLKLEFIRGGGNPEAPWAEIIRWHQSRKNGRSAGARPSAS